MREISKDRAGRRDWPDDGSGDITGGEMSRNLRRCHRGVWHQSSLEPMLGGDDLAVMGDFKVVGEGGVGVASQTSRLSDGSVFLQEPAKKWPEREL